MRFSISPRAQYNCSYKAFIGHASALKEVTTKFDREEPIFQVKCDVHPWMLAHVNVFDHPFFAVTGADGGFEIKGLPAGSYTLEAWHETLGTRTQKVTADGKKAVTHRGTSGER